MRGRDIAEILHNFDEEIFVSLPSENGYHLVNIQTIEFCTLDTGEDAIIMFPFKPITEDLPLN